MKQTKVNNQQSVRRAIRFLPVITWMGVIFWSSSRTGDQLDAALPWIQQLFPYMVSFNWGHFVSYFILALLFDFAIGRKADKWRVKGLIVLLCFLYGVTDEYHQKFVEGRMSDTADLRNDTIGAALAVLSLKIPAVRRLWRKIAH
ncbi:VanZ family protein [Paenibacillus abyssi]|uniref:VanZ-like domain-containing protein n=1 Tax=Paenibacillus abyssi TaxID=1340531 RepID=A0A917D5F4_9BACL|nr:VanZ family protein [Paenibacillus abyssi]GGG09436.1 hypothetical protein GCM10010916_27830 [Paenibacillus abyssi]